VLAALLEPHVLLIEIVISLLHKMMLCLQKSHN